MLLRKRGRLSGVGYSLQISTRGATFLLAVISFRYWSSVIPFPLKSYAAISFQTTELNISVLTVYGIIERWLFLVSRELKESSASLHQSHSPASALSLTAHRAVRRKPPLRGLAGDIAKALGNERITWCLTTHSFLVSLP